ncbi:flagellar protein FlaG [Vreelandella sulfidaeris]|uniref:flagellar protein FlaG n=1 Tax=Vreelandella sulfidaeris TaxID=115553 RepID=UPI0035EA52D8
MSLLPTDTVASLALTASPSTPKQRLENTLAQLATTNSQLKSAETNPNKHEFTSGELIEPIERINATMRPRGLEFELSEESSRIITRVVDRESGEVIRQIPAEEVIKIAERLEEMQGQIISLEA